MFYTADAHLRCRASTGEVLRPRPGARTSLVSSMHLRKATLAAGKSLRSQLLTGIGPETMPYLAG